MEINKPIKLIELFAGVGSQAMALRNIGANFEHHRVVEFDKYAMASYNAIHGTEFETTDIREIKGSDLWIDDTEHYTYLLTYLLFPMPGPFCSREREWHEERKWHKKRTFVGSGKAAERNK